MENKEERVLAYSLSKIINQESLAAISGGVHMCSRGSLGGSAGSGQGAEVHVDVVVDW